MSEVLVVGSLAYDSVKTPSGKADKSLGGSANYFSVAASLFSKVRVVGVVGEDYLISDKKLLLDRGVDLTGMQTVPGQTFHWEGTYEQNLNEAVTLKTELNVFASFNPQLPENYKDSKYVFLANIDPTLQLQVLAQIAKPLFVGMDTMNFWINSKQSELIKVLKKVNIVFMNETEAKMLTQVSNPITAIKKIAEMGGRILALEKERPHIPFERAIMALRFNEHFIGTQFHPEADPEGMTMHLQKDGKKKIVIDNYGEAKWNSMIDQLNDPDKILYTYKHILPNFLNKAVEQIAA